MVSRYFVTNFNRNEVKKQKNKSNIFSLKFQGLVLGSIKLIDGKGIDVA